jgi:hypothetical protein
MLFLWAYKRLSPLIKVEPYLSVQGRSLIYCSIVFLSIAPPRGQAQITHVEAPATAISKENDNHSCAQKLTLKGYRWQLDQTSHPAVAASTSHRPPEQEIPKGRVNQGTATSLFRSASSRSSVYIPIDSWVYPAVLRLYSLGFVDSAFLNMRPWTRNSVYRMLEESKDVLLQSGNSEALGLYDKLLSEFAIENSIGWQSGCPLYGVETIYTRVVGIKGTPLTDSYHLGQTLINDYGRPYQTGLNTITGSSERVEIGRFSLYVRGEYQHAPAAPGYSPSMFQQLSTIDQVPLTSVNQVQATIPQTSIADQNAFRIVEANVSAHFIGHEISFGKTDAWLGPGFGGSMAWSNNAENLYTFRINRVDPINIPWVSKVTGPIRYDFFIGSLKGHTDPNSPWMHSTMLSFSPTRNVQLGFQRSVIWGGKGHVPVTVHTFLRSFFSIDDVTTAMKITSADPGARFSDFNFSWRLPFVRNYLTLYADSITHDDVTPISAPRRAAFRTGIYLSQFPGLRKMDLRLEATTTDPAVRPSLGGRFNYWESIQHQGYTNKGFLIGDWIGREAKGGQSWITYHLSGNEFIQLAYLNKKNAKDFIPGGTTQNQYKLTFVKRLHSDLELGAWVQIERWKAPIYKIGAQNDASMAFQLSWYPMAAQKRP